MHTPESPAHATGVKVSRVVFGGNVLGWTADQATGFAMLDRLVDAGLTTIDTADVYSGWVPGHQGGESESVIGAWLRDVSLWLVVVINLVIAALIYFGVIEKAKPSAEIK